MRGGDYVYHNMKREDVADKHKISDFKETGTRELVADDYVYGIRRLATPRIKSPSFSTMSDYIIGLKEYGERIVATDKELRKSLAPTDRDLPFLDFRQYPFAGAEALDKYTLSIRVKGKYPQFKYWLAMTFFSPIPWEAEKFYAQPGMAEKNLTLNFWPVGTGPFMQTEYIENRRHVLERNPNFRGEPYPCEGEPGDREKGYLADCGKPIPFVDKVVFDLEKEGVPLQAKFLQGYYDSPAIERLDYGTGMIVAMSDDKKKEKEYRDKGIRLPTTIEANNWYIGFNWLDPVVGKGDTPAQAERNRKLRQALSIAIDWEEHVAIFERGQGVAAQGPLPPSLFGYREDGPSAFNPVVYRKGPDGKPVRRSIEEAKKLLAEAGYPDGRDAKTGKPLVLNFDYQSSPTPGVKALLDWYTKQFAKIGVQMEVRATDYNRFQDKMSKGSVQIFFWGWLADYPDAENFLFMLYGPNAKALTDGNGENNTNYQNPEFDKLFEQMKFLEDGPDKQKLIDRMIEITQNDAIWSFGYFPTSAAAYHQWISNGKPTQIVRNHIGYLQARSGASGAEDRRMEPAGLVADPADRAGARRRDRARLVRLAPPRARDRRAHARRRGRRAVINYIIRRVGYGVLILIGVNLFTFLLFFTVNTPDDMARMNIGGKRVSQDAIEKWKVERGYDKPLFWNGKEEGARKLTNTIFVERSAQLFAFDFGASDSGRDIGYELKRRVGPSVALAIPTFILGIFVVIVFSLLLVFFRNTYLEFWGVTLAVFLLSISSLFYIIVGQFFFSKLLRLVPISGFAGGVDLVVFLALPILIGIASRLGGEALFYRTMFLEEIGKDYVRTARSKGLSETVVLFRHVLRNALLPILTSTVAILPLLFLGALIMESFFGIPGLGSYTIDAINAQDFAVVRTMVFVGSALYVVGLILTDISYTIADPRIRLG